MTMTKKQDTKSVLKFNFSFVFTGFGKDERNRDGNIQQTNVTLLSNEECYEKLSNIMKTNVQGYNNRIKIQQAVYDGITDQLICTNGLVVEKCRKGRCRKFFSVSRPFPHKDCFEMNVPLQMTCV